MTDVMTDFIYPAQQYSSSCTSIFLLCLGFSGCAAIALLQQKQLLKDKSDPHSLKLFIERNMSETLKNVVQSSISPVLKGINDKLDLSVELVSQLWDPSEDGAEVTNSGHLTTLAEIAVTKPFSVPCRPLGEIIPDFEYKSKVIGVEESISRSSLELQLEDKTSVDNVLSDLGVNCHIRDCHRLGRFSDDKTRPLLVIFNSVWDSRLCRSRAIV